MGKLLDIIQKDLQLQGFQKRSLEARTWLQNRVKKMYGMSRESLVNDPQRQVREPSMGLMHMFFYIPKLKETLPYYDKFPLVLPIESYSDGWLGLNFHYLPMNLRVGLLDKLYDLLNNNNFDETTRIQASYGVLKGVARYRAFKPCIKRYLYTHVQSKIVAVEAESWETVCFLPVQVFAKASAQKVWADSRVIISEDTEVDE